MALWFTLPILDGLDIISVSYAPVISLLASESLLFLVAFVASLEPLRRAAKADPLENHPRNLRGADVSER